MGKVVAPVGKVGLLPEKHTKRCIKAGASPDINLGRISDRFLNQLENCKDDEARRLLLGKKRIAVVDRLEG